MRSFALAKELRLDTRSLTVDLICDILNENGEIIDPDKSFRTNYRIDINSNGEVVPIKYISGSEVEIVPMEIAGSIGIGNQVGHSSVPFDVAMEFGKQKQVKNIGVIGNTLANRIFLLMPENLKITVEELEIGTDIDEKEDLKVYETPSLVTKTLFLLQNKAYRDVDIRTRLKYGLATYINRMLSKKLDAVSKEKLETLIEKALTIAEAGKEFTSGEIRKVFNAENYKEIGIAESRIGELNKYFQKYGENFRKIINIYSKYHDKPNKLKEELSKVSTKLAEGIKHLNMVVIDYQAGSGKDIIEAMDYAGYEDGVLTGIELKEINPESERNQVVYGVNFMAVKDYLQNTLANNLAFRKYGIFYLNPPYTGSGIIERESVMSLPEGAVFYGLFPTKSERLISNNIEGYIFEIPREFTGYTDPKTPERFLLVFGIKRQGRGSAVKFALDKDEIEGDITPEKISDLLLEKINSFKGEYHLNKIASNIYARDGIATYLSNYRDFSIANFRQSINVAIKKFYNKEKIKNYFLEAGYREIIDGFSLIDKAREGLKVFPDLSIFSPDGKYPVYSYDEIKNNSIFWQTYKDNYPALYDILKSIAQERGDKIPIREESEMFVTNKHLGLMYFSLVPENFDLTDDIKEVILEMYQELYNKGEVNEEDLKTIEAVLEKGERVVVKSKAVLDTTSDVQLGKTSIISIVDSYGVDIAGLNIDLSLFYKRLEEKGIIDIKNNYIYLEPDLEFKKQVVENFVDYIYKILNSIDFTKKDLSMYLRSLVDVARSHLTQEEKQRSIQRFQSYYISKIEKKIEEIYRIADVREYLAEALKNFSATTYEIEKLLRDAIINSIIEIYTQNPYEYGFDPDKLSDAIDSTLTKLIPDGHPLKGPSYYLSLFNAVKSGVDKHFTIRNTISRGAFNLLISMTSVYKMDVLIKKGLYEKAYEEFKNLLLNKYGIFPHQFNEGMNIAYKAVRYGDAGHVLGWEMRSGKTMAMLLSGFITSLINKEDTYMFVKTANLNDISSQMIRFLPPLIFNTVAYKSGSLKPDLLNTREKISKDIYPNITNDKNFRDMLIDGKELIEELSISYTDDIEGILKVVRENINSNPSYIQSLRQKYKVNPFSGILTNEELPEDLRATYFFYLKRLEDKGVLEYKRDKFKKLMNSLANRYRSNVSENISRDVSIGGFTFHLAPKSILSTFPVSIEKSSKVLYSVKNFTVTANKEVNPEFTATAKVDVKVVQQEEESGKRKRVRSEVVLGNLPKEFVKEVIGIDEPLHPYVFMSEYFDRYLDIDDDLYAVGKNTVEDLIDENIGKLSSKMADEIYNKMEDLDIEGIEGETAQEILIQIYRFLETVGYPDIDAIFELNEDGRVERINMKEFNRQKCYQILLDYLSHKVDTIFEVVELYDDALNTYVTKVNLNLDTPEHNILPDFLKKETFNRLLLGFESELKVRYSLRSIYSQIFTLVFYGNVTYEELQPKLKRLGIKMESSGEEVIVSLPLRIKEDSKGIPVLTPDKNEVQFSLLDARKTLVDKENPDMLKSTPVQKEIKVFLSFKKNKKGEISKKAKASVTVNIDVKDDTLPNPLVKLSNNASTVFVNSDELKKPKNVIVDEADENKDPEGLYYLLTKSFTQNAKLRVMATGTPTNGYPESLFSLIGLASTKSIESIKEDVTQAEKQFSIYIVKDTNPIAKATILALSYFGNLFAQDLARIARVGETKDVEPEAEHLIPLIEEYLQTGNYPDLEDLIKKIKSELDVMKVKYDALKFLNALRNVINEKYDLSPSEINFDIVVTALLSVLSASRTISREGGTLNPFKFVKAIPRDVSISFQTRDNVKKLSAELLGLKPVEEKVNYVDLNIGKRLIEEEKKYGRVVSLSVDESIILPRIREFYDKFVVPFRSKAMLGQVRDLIISNIGNYLNEIVRNPEPFIERHKLDLTPEDIKRLIPSSGVSTTDSVKDILKYRFEYNDEYPVPLGENREIILKKIQIADLVAKDFREIFEDNGYRDILLDYKDFEESKADSDYINDGFEVEIGGYSVPFKVVPLKNLNGDRVLIHSLTDYLQPVATLIVKNHKTEDEEVVLEESTIYLSEDVEFYRPSWGNILKEPEPITYRLKYLSEDEVDLIDAFTNKGYRDWIERLIEEDKNFLVTSERQLVQIFALYDFLSILLEKQSIYKPEERNTCNVIVRIPQGNMIPELLERIDEKKLSKYGILLKKVKDNNTLDFENKNLQRVQKLDDSVRVYVFSTVGTVARGVDLSNLDFHLNIGAVKNGSDMSQAMARTVNLKDKHIVNLALVGTPVKYSHSEISDKLKPADTLKGIMKTVSKVEFTKAVMSGKAVNVNSQPKPVVSKVYEDVINKELEMENEEKRKMRFTA